MTPCFFFTRLLQLLLDSGSTGLFTPLKNPTSLPSQKNPLEISGACILLSRLAADGDAAVASLLLVETEVDRLELVVAQLEAANFFVAL